MSGKAGVGWNLILLVYIFELKEGSIEGFVGLRGKERQEDRGWRIRRRHDSNKDS